MTAPKYARPEFLPSNVDQKRYEKWLEGRARAHFSRDRERGNRRATLAEYKMAIHRAVLHSDGRDPYTGELLDWSLVGQYRNAESEVRRREYKSKFAALPTVDHVGDGLGEADFRLCRWITNEAKSSLTYDEFVTLCRKVVNHFDERQR